MNPKTEILGDVVNVDQKPFKKDDVKLNKCPLITLASVVLNVVTVNVLKL